MQILSLCFLLHEKIETVQIFTTETQKFQNLFLVKYQRKMVWKDFEATSCFQANFGSRQLMKLLRKVRMKQLIGSDWFPPKIFEWIYSIYIPNCSMSHSVVGWGFATWLLVPWAMVDLPGKPVESVKKGRKNHILLGEKGNNVNVKAIWDATASCFSEIVYWTFSHMKTILSVKKTWKKQKKI